MSQSQSQSQSQSHDQAQAQGAAPSSSAASENTAHPAYHERYNAFVAVFVLSVVYTGLFIAATATGFNIFQNGQQYITQTFFWTQNTNNGAEVYTRTTSACKDLQALIEAGRAFSIMTDIVAGIIMLWSFARLFHNDLLLGSGRAVFMFWYVLLFCFSTVFWILPFAAFSERWCGASFTDDSNNKVGPCGPCAISAWAIVIAAWVVELMWDGYCENPAPHTVSNASSAHVMVPAASVGVPANNAPA